MPTFDAHMNPFCPMCERPVQFKDLFKKKMKRADGAE